MGGSSIALRRPVTTAENRTTRMERAQLFSQSFPIEGVGLPFGHELGLRNWGPAGSVIDGACMHQILPTGFCHSPSGGGRRCPTYRRHRAVVGLTTTPFALERWREKLGSDDELPVFIFFETLSPLDSAARAIASHIIRTLKDRVVRLTRRNEQVSLCSLYWFFF
jgi:hypothetical protein